MTHVLEIATPALKQNQSNCNRYNHTARHLAGFSLHRTGRAIGVFDWDVVTVLTQTTKEGSCRVNEKLQSI